MASITLVFGLTEAHRIKVSLCPMLSQADLAGDLEGSVSVSGTNGFVLCLKSSMFSNVLI